MQNNSTVIEIMKIVDEFSRKKDEIIKNAPYHLNIIDELHANENAHSRIFTKILQYKDSDSYPFLISFLRSLNLDIEVVSPTITTEKERIDCLIKDKSYAVIVENKINYAVDQNEQIIRYVNSLKKSYSLEKIHVLYLTRWGKKEVSEISLSNELRIDLGERFKPINYRFDILNWLENEVIQNCKMKDKQLIHAIEQYIDYLKGMFNLRENSNYMDKEINKTIKDYYKLDENSVNFDSEVSENVSNLQGVQNYLLSIQVRRRNKLRKEFLENLYIKLGKGNWDTVKAVYIPELDYNNKSFGFRNIEQDLQTNIANKDLFLSIEIQHWKTFICGIFTNRNEEINKMLLEFFNDRSVNVINSEWWIYLNPEEYIIDEKKIGFDFYNDDFNFLFLDKTDELLEIFYNRIINFRSLWQEFCQKTNQ